MNVPPFLRGINQKAEMLGFRFVGYTGSQHPRFYNADVDAYVTTSLTPSDFRSERNVISDMERISGRRLPRSNSGHHRHRPVRKQMVTALSDVERETLDRVDALLVEADELQGKWCALIAGTPNRTTAIEAREILEAHEKVRRELGRLHRLIPPLSVA